MRWAPVALALLLCLPLAARAGQEVDVDELAGRIERARDEADPAWYEALAQARDAASLRALLRCLDRLRDEALYAEACLALRHYSDRPELRADAVEWLRREAGRGRDAARKQAAVRALARCGDATAEVLEAVLERNDDAGCRSLACDALAPLLLARGDAESVEQVLTEATLAREPVEYVGLSSERDAALAGRPHAEVLAELLAGLDSPELRALYLERLLEGEPDRRWKLLLVELLEPRAGSEVSKGLAAAIGDPDPAVAAAALRALEARDDWDGYEDELRELLRAEDPALRRAAVQSLGRLALGRPEWPAEVLELSRARDAALRMGAAACLSELRTPEALARLDELLADEDWTVRVEALERVARMRRAGTVPVLIERLEAERGRMVRDVHAALCSLTGLGHGLSPERWRRWWAAEGATFEPPTLEESARAARMRAERGAAGGTVASTFHGLEVRSERVQFVIDISGSMALPPGVFDPAAYVPPGTKRRIDVAKAELSATLRGLEDGRLFNVIFFDTEVRPFSEHLVRMRRRDRTKALRFVDEQIALGATALYPALRAAFADPLVDTLFVLTDGAPTVGELTDIREIRAEVARWNATRKVRVHGVAMGIDSDLLRWLAEDTGGTYTRVD